MEFKMNLRKTLVWLGTLALTLMPTLAFAQEATEGGKNPYGALAAAFAIGVAAFGGAFGQGKTAAAALEGIGRNPAAQPKIFVPMIIGLALIESLVLYALVIAFRLS